MRSFNVCCRLLKSVTSNFLRKNQSPSKSTNNALVAAADASKFENLSDKLLFILIYQKTIPLQTMHGLSFGLSQTQVNYWVHRLLPVLQRSLSEMGMKPERDGKKVAQRIEAVEGGANLSLDGTERRLQRPVNIDKQKQNYSGKAS